MITTVVLAILGGANQSKFNKVQADLMKLAATGAPASLAAVRKALNIGRTIPKLTDRAKLPTTTTNPDVILSKSIDAKGVTWALIKWNALGGGEDLWVVRRSGTKWIDPIYTGLNTYWPHYYPGGGPVEKGFASHEKEMNALIAMKGWVKRFVNNPAVKIDTDKDGYTDITEQCLGLNPKNPDSDGDGIVDGIDKNPFAKNYPMSDNELAMQAALAMKMVSFGSYSDNIKVKFPKGISVFEIGSWRGLVLPVVLPSGFPPRQGQIAGSWYTISPNVKQLSKDGTFVEIGIQQNGGYYEANWGAQVRKFGKEWFCVAIVSRGMAVS